MPGPLADLLSIALQRQGWVPVTEAIGVTQSKIFSASPFTGKHPNAWKKPQVKIEKTQQLTSPPFRVEKKSVLIHSCLSGCVLIFIVFIMCKSWE